MTTPVNFELAKLLKEKGFDEQWNIHMYTPTIAEVVMWLYEKHEIWIEVRRTYFLKEFRFQSYINENALIGELGGYLSQEKPTEAYEAAIKYALEKIIK